MTFSDLAGKDGWTLGGCPVAAAGQYEKVVRAKPVERLIAAAETGQ